MTLSACRSLPEYSLCGFIEQPRSAAKLDPRGHRTDHAEPQRKKPLSSCEDNGFRLVVGADLGSIPCQ